MNEQEFRSFPKMPRLEKLSMVITEKIDGTNAAICIFEDESYFCQSRKRIITPEDDNFEFAAWVKENEDWLIPYLGPGRHYGEWWGSKIQRGYGLEERRFSLFNTHRFMTDADYHNENKIGPGLHVVPTLHKGAFDMVDAQRTLDALMEHGSYAAPYFPNPEGVVVYIPQLNKLIKHPFESGHKWEKAA